MEKSKRIMYNGITVDRAFLKKGYETASAGVSLSSESIRKEESRWVLTGKSRLLNNGTRKTRSRIAAKDNRY